VGGGFWCGVKGVRIVANRRHKVGLGGNKKMWWYLLVVAGFCSNVATGRGFWAGEWRPWFDDGLCMGGAGTQRGCRAGLGV